MKNLPQKAEGKELSLNQDFNRKVMRRVIVVYYVKKLTKPIFLEIAGLAASMAVITQLVSVGAVIANSPDLLEFDELFGFIGNAFANTEMPVQTGIFVVVILSLTVAKTSYGLISEYLRNSREEVPLRANS